jgi:chromosome segregation ATPase
MRKVSDFLARAGVSSTPETLAALTSKPQNSNRPDDSGKSTFANIGERIGGDNEALRHLLIDTGLQFGALDELKETFGRLVDPLHNMLSTLEQAKFDNASLRGALTELRSSHETLRSEFEGLEKKSSDLEGDNHRLTRELTAAQQSAQELEGDKTKLTGETAAMRVALANLEKQLGEETNSGRSLSDEKRLLLERADAADKRIIESEAAANLAREKLSLLENEKDSLQTALDQTLAQSSRTSRRLAEIENALSEARARLQQMEHNLAAVEDERKKLSATLDEANERRQSEVYALTLKLDAMRSRSTAAEKLLAEMRQSLVARTEEIRVTEAKLMEAVLGRSGAEKKAEQLSAANEAHDRQNKKLEQTRLSLTDRSNVLSETVKARDSSLSHAQDKIKALTDRVELFKAEAAANHAKAEKRIEQLNSAIERERAERAVAEGALEATRGDYARLQREISAERSLRRRSAPEEVFDADKAKEARPAKNGNGAGHGAGNGEPAAAPPHSGAA